MYWGAFRGRGGVEHMSACFMYIHMYVYIRVDTHNTCCMYICKYLHTIHTGVHVCCCSWYLLCFSGLVLLDPVLPVARLEEDEGLTVVLLHLYQVIGQLCLLALLSAQLLRNTAAALTSLSTESSTHGHTLML